MVNAGRTWNQPNCCVQLNEFVIVGQIVHSLNMGHYCPKICIDLHGSMPRTYIIKAAR